MYFSDSRALLLILQGSAIYHDAIDLFVLLSMIDRAVDLISIH